MFYTKESQREKENLIHVDISAIIIYKSQVGDGLNSINVLMKEGLFPARELIKKENLIKTIQKICENALDFYTPSDYNMLNWAMATDPIISEEDEVMTICYGVILKDKSDCKEPFEWKKFEDLNTKQRKLLTQIIRKV